MRRSIFRARGSVLIEILVALAIFAVLGFALTSVSLDALVADRIGGERQEALANAQEGLEASRQIRNRSWGAVAPGAYGVTTETVGTETRYAFSGANDTSGVYTRTVTVENVERDASGNIVSLGGTIDPDTRKVTARVTWGATPREVKLVTYLANWSSLSWTETLKSQFEQGVLTNTEAVPATAPPTGNGTVQLLGAGSGADLAVKGVVNVDTGGPADGRDVALAGGGTAYLLVSQGAGQSKLYVVDVSNPLAPSICVTCVVDPPSAKANAVAAYGSYVYVATDRNDGELMIFNVANAASPAFVGKLDIDTDANSDGLSVAVDGSFLYIGTGNNTSSAPATELYRYSLANPAVPALSARVEISANVNGIAPLGSKVYLATSHDTGEVTLVDFAPATPTVTRKDLTGTAGAADATSIVVTGNRAFVTRVGSQQFVILDIANFSAAPLSQTSVGAVANDVAVEGGYAYISTDHATQEFQRWNISNPQAPALAGTTDLAGVGRGLAVGGNYAYVTTDGDSQELAIIASSGAGAGITEAGFMNTALPLAAYTEVGQSIFLTGTTILLGTDGRNHVHTIDVKNPSSPAMLDSLIVDGDVQDIAVSGTHAYLAVAYGADIELYVINIANPADITLAATFNVSVDKGGYSVAVSGNRLYLGLGKAIGDNTCVGNFVVFDISNPLAPAFLGQTDVGAAVFDIAVDPKNQNFVYVALSSWKTFGSVGCDPSDSLIQQSPPPPPPPDPSPTATPPVSLVPEQGDAPRLSRVLRGIFGRWAVRPADAQQASADLKRIDVSNPALPVAVASFNAPDNDWGTGVAVSGSNVFLVTSTKSSAPEFYILKYENGSLVQLGSGSALEIGAVVRGISVSGTRAYLVTHGNGKEFMVIDITNPLSPFVKKTFDLSSFARSVTVSGTYAYVGTGDSAKELVILQGVEQLGLAATGTADSIAFNAGQVRLWENLSWTSVLNGGNVRLQVRWGNDLASLSAAPYVGPDGSSATYYAASVTPLTTCAGCGGPTAQWFQWRALLEGTGSSSPELHDVTVTFR